MHIPQHIRQQACEGLLHFVPQKTLARQLGVSQGSIRDWEIYVRCGFFDWIDKPWITRRKELLSSAVDYWFENYPIGYTDVAKRFGIRPGTLYGSIKRTVAKLPSNYVPNAFISGTFREKQLQENSGWPSKNSRISLPIAR